MAEFEVERVGGELGRFGVSGSPAPFEVVSPFEPSGDQPQAIASLVQGVRDGDRYQVLLGVTGSGKTFTMAKTIEALGKPTLVMAPNKTLAAQLAWGSLSGALGCHRIRQDLHDGEDHRGFGQTDACHGTEQDARRSARE